MNTFSGNPNLKAQAQSISYTEDQVNLLRKYINDPISFIEEQVKIEHVDHGLIPFKPFEFQKRMIDAYHNNRFTICKVGRQSGKSTITIAYLLWYVLFNDNKNVALLANKLDTARELMNRIQRAYEILPFWLQQGVKEWNKLSISIENGSRIQASATSSSSVRGQSFSFIFMDEFAFLEPNKAEDFFRSTWPTISSGKTTKVVAVSTPNGMNSFYRLWKGAEEAQTILGKIEKGEELSDNEKEKYLKKQISEWFPVEVHWTEVPGRDDEWKQKEIANFGSVERFNTEYGCEFLGSTSTLIDGSVLFGLKPVEPINSIGFCNIYEMPIDEHVYVSTVDTSRGKGFDCSAFSIFDVTEFPYKQVAAYKSDEVQPEEYHLEILRIANAYNNAYVLIELNDVGAQVAAYLKMDIGYENVISTMTKANKQMISAGFGKSKPGIMTSKQTKQIGCQTLKTLIETDNLIICSADTINELFAFSIQTNGTYEADAGNNDDLVTTLFLFAWLQSQQYFKLLTDKDSRQRLAEAWGNQNRDDFIAPIIDSGQYWEIMADRGYDKLVSW